MTEEQKMPVNIRFILFCICLSLLAAPAHSLVNPSAMYCTALGYNFTIEESAGQIGYCIMHDGKKIDSWRFLQGMEGAEYGYCARNNLTQKTVENPTTCIIFLTESCAACQYSNGSIFEVTKLMNLNFLESKCGDKNCGFPENYKDCPADCPSGVRDRYCDGILDGRCDNDCMKKAFADLDCPFMGIPVTFIVGIGALIIVMVSVGYLMIKKQKT